jgi:hypothetical protein
MKNPLYKIEISHKDEDNKVWHVEISREKDKRSFGFYSLQTATEFIAGYITQNGRGV